MQQLKGINEICIDFKQFIENFFNSLLNGDLEEVFIHPWNCYSSCLNLNFSQETPTPKLANPLKPVESTKSAVKGIGSKVRNLDWDSDYHLCWLDHASDLNSSLERESLKFNNFSVPQAAAVADPLKPAGLTKSSIRGNSSKVRNPYSYFEIFSSATAWLVFMKKSCRVSQKIKVNLIDIAHNFCYRPLIWLPNMSFGMSKARPIHLRHKTTRLIILTALIAAANVRADILHIFSGAKKQKWITLLPTLRPIWGC